MDAALLAVPLSFILALGPAVTPALAEEAPLAARITAARRQLQGHMAAATLARADYEPLQQEYESLPSPPKEARRAWGGFEPVARRYNELRLALVAIGPDELATRVRGLSRDLALAAAGEDALVARYAQLQATLAKSGVSARDGKLYDHDGKEMTEAGLAALMAKALPPRPTDAERRAQIADLRGLGDVQASLDKKDYQSAVNGLNKVLENMSARPDLVQTGFGSLPAQTALSLIQKTRETLPAQYRQQVKTGALDRQLLSIADKKIDVPAAGAGETPAGAHEPTPFRTGVELAFYASLTGFPLVSHWAEKNLYNTQVANDLSQQDAVASFRYSDRAPDGAAKPGFYVAYKDGSRRYESRDGSSVVTSSDGKTILSQNPAAGSFRQTELDADGKPVEVLAWERGADGSLRGRFRGRPFQAGPRQQVALSADQTKLFVTEGLQKDGAPNVKTWLGPDGERGRMLPDGLGAVVWHKEDGRPERDIFLEPAALERAAAGKLDLSALSPDLDGARAKKFQTLLADLPRLDSRLEAPLESAQIRDGRLTLSYGARGESKTGMRVASEVESDGTLKTFLFKDRLVRLWKFNPAQDVCEQAAQDAEAQVAAGKVEFKLLRRYERRGGEWVMTDSAPIAPKTWTWTDGLAAIGSGTLDGLGKVGEFVFSPVQSAHHYLHSGLVSVAARGADLAGAEPVSRWADVDGKYSRAQSTANKWFSDSNVDDARGRMTVYQDSLRTIEDPQRRKEFLGFLDTTVEETRRARYGELYRFHKDDPIGEQDRADAAAGVFGLGNLASGYSQTADEQFARGNTWTGVGLKGVKYFAIGGQMYVQGAAFGAASQSLKMWGLAQTTGLETEQVAQAALKSRLLAAGAEGFTLTAAEAKAASVLTWTSRAEAAAFVAPAAGYGAVDVYKGGAAWLNGDTKTALAHLDSLMSTGAALFLPMAMDAGRRFAENKIAGMPLLGGGEKGEKAPDPNQVAAAKLRETFLETVKEDNAEAEKQARSLLETDSMTGLPNRAHIDRVADEALSRMKDPAVAIMDMNNFGAVNDGLAQVFGASGGRAKADTMLAKASTRLKSLAKLHNVTLGRYGGEEFAVLGEKADVLSFIEACKPEFSQNQTLSDAGYGPETPEYKAIKDAAIAKQRGDQSIGDFTFGLASAKIRRFLSAMHDADAALNMAKKIPGGRGNAFVTIPGGKGTLYGLSDLSLDQAGKDGIAQGKDQRDTTAKDPPPSDFTARYERARQQMSPERFQEFMKLAFVDPLTGAREYDYLRVEEPRINKKYGDGHGEAAMISARGLKLLNDALGHEKGDIYLKALGKAVTEAVARQRGAGHNTEDAVRYQSKDFLIFGEDVGAMIEATNKAMDKLLRGDDLMTPAERAKVEKLANERGEDAALTGTLRVVKQRFSHGESGQGDVFKTIDGLVNASDAAKKGEGQPKVK